MSDRTDIPAEWLERNPLMSSAGYRNLQRILQHPDAPRWNFATGDRLVERDLRVIDDFRQAVFSAPSASVTDRPPPSLLEAIRNLRDRSWWFQDHIPAGLDIAKEWPGLPTMDRATLSTGLPHVVPHDLHDFSRLLSYDTSGTTGHAVDVPHVPETVGKNHPLLEKALDDLGVSPDFGADTVAVANVCAQVNTFVFASVFSVWNEAGFAKLNLHPKDWSGGRDAARRYLADLEPQVVTSDPISLAEMIRWDIDVQPIAIVSTALALSDSLRMRIADRYGCPVLDWYSTTETGPIAYRASGDEGYELLPHDIFVEIVDDHGHPVPDGELGAIVVTSLRNPWLPLFRYRTGDHARLRRGDRPMLYDLHGRRLVHYRSSDDEAVNPVDIGRIMRLHGAFVQHRFLQREDLSCEVRIRPIPGVGVDVVGIEAKLRTLFGEVPIEVLVDEQLGESGEKVIPYVSELEL
jgi:phenylacetate-CoA ligase